MNGIFAIDSRPSSIATRLVEPSSSASTTNTTSSIDWEGTPGTYHFGKGNAILQFDGAAATNLSHRYLWSDRVDGLFADEQITSPSTTGNTLWGLADNFGTLRDIADFNESTLATTVANHRTFNANGKLVAETNAAVALLFAFTGKQLDDSTGLQHNLYRWNEANLGQWLSEDPIGFAAGDENLRRYVGNGVLFALDPNGLVKIGQVGPYRQLVEDSDVGDGLERTILGHSTLPTGIIPRKSPKTV